MPRPKGSKNKPKYDENGNVIKPVRKKRTPAPVVETEDVDKSVQKTDEFVESLDKEHPTKAIDKESDGIATAKSKQSHDEILQELEKKVKRNRKMELSKNVLGMYAEICQKCQLLADKRCEGIVPHPNMPVIKNCADYKEAD